MLWSKSTKVAFLHVQKTVGLSVVAALVAERFKRDIETFGYKFD
jgi:hypothetical protein